VKRKLFVGETTSDSAIIPILKMAAKVARNENMAWFAYADVEGVVARGVDGNIFNHERQARIDRG
jgi:hypothetical protein